MQGQTSVTTGERWPRRLVAAWLLLIAVWLIVLGALNLRHPSDWAMGDWLINYSGGFVRRGLLGEGALWLHRFGFAPMWAILLLQWSLYATVLLVLWRLVQSIQPRFLTSWWVAASLVSPATLAFVLLDPPFAFRKEILLFALTSLVLAQFLSTSRTPRDGWQSKVRLAALLTGGCGVCVLAHEGLLVYFPYVFGAVVLGLRRLRTALQVLFLPTLVSLALFPLVSRYPGNAQVARAVCDAIGGQITDPPSGICGGAVAYLTHTSAYAHAEVRQQLLHEGWRLVPWVFVLPLVPAAFGLAHLRKRQPFAFRTVLTCAGLSGALSVSLFYYGTDWTRWMYIHAFSLMLLMLFAAWQGQWEPSTADRGASRRWWPGVIGLLVYALGWELTVYGQKPLYASFFRFVMHHLLPGKQ